MDHYRFNGIGNRTSIQTGGDSTATNLRTATYTPDALNPYTAITQPGFLEIHGKAPITQALTVNALATTRQGRDFRKELAFPVSGDQSTVLETQLINDPLPQYQVEGESHQSAGQTGCGQI